MLGRHPEQRNCSIPVPTLNQLRNGMGGVFVVRNKDIMPHDRGIPLVHTRSQYTRLSITLV